MGRREVVIIGAGRAGHTLARFLRRRNNDCIITLIAAHDGAVYPKSALAYALGLKREPAALVEATAARVAARERLQILVDSPVQSIDLAQRRLNLRHASLPFDQLVLALGEEMRLPPVLQGSANALSINRLADYAALCARLTHARRVLIAGSGVSACEFANDLVASGRQAIIIDTARHPLGERLPGLIGARLRRMLAAAGVEFHLAERIVELENTPGGRLRARSASGTLIEADVAVALPAPNPRVALAAEAGLSVGRRGIVVDEFLRCEHENVFALGACAALPEGIRHASIEAQAKALAESLEGRPTRPESRPEARRLNTPACPLVLFDPPAVGGEWQERATASEVTALFVDRAGDLRGFALLGACVHGQDAWLARLSTH